MRWFKTSILTAVATATALLLGWSPGPNHPDPRPPKQENKENIAPPTEEAVAEPDLSGTLFLDLHSKIFITKCAVPACHDGNFEPDFTTPQAMYYSTVLHPATKKTGTSSFTYRVVPGDTTSSVLLERITNCCFINENDRMPVLMEPLSKAEIDSIAHWINIGAPDWRNNFPYQH